MLRKNRKPGSGIAAMVQLVVLGLLGMVFAVPAQASSNVPPVVISNLTTLASGLSNTAGVATDACGNVYAVTAATGQITEIPAGGGTPTTIANTGGGTGWSPSGLWIDAAKKFLYVANGKDQTDRIPIVNCVVQSSNTTAISVGNLGAISYWYTTNVVASDAAGNIFIGTNNACCASSKELLEESADNNTGTTLLGSLPAQIDSLAVDPNNNIFFASGGQVYELVYSNGAYAASQISFGGSFSNATGVNVDSVGNLYITDSGASIIYEIPNESGTLNPNDRFVLAKDIAASAAVAIGQSGNLYFSNGGSSVYQLKIGGANLGSQAVGAAVSTTLGVAFNASATPKTVGLSTGNGAYSVPSATCAAGTAYVAGDACTVTVGFTPTAPGSSNSALIVTDASGASLGLGYLAGQGVGAGLTVDPGTVATVGSGYRSPEGAAVDAAGNLFIADSTANAVYEVAAGTSTPVALGSGLNSPRGVAVDGYGNVFVADYGNNRIVEIPVVNGALATSAQSVVIASGTTLVGTALKTPQSIAIDGSGNLYIADTGNSRVVLVPFNGGWNTASAVVLGSGFLAPSALALDLSGNLYVTDATTGAVYELASISTNLVQTTVVTGYSSPSGIAVDASGALFVVDSGNTKVWRIPNLSGALTPSKALNVVGQLAVSGSQIVANPYGVAVDGAGNVYVTDNANAAAYTVARTSSTQSAGIWSPGSTSGTLTYYVENAGNAALTFGTPYATASGDVADFSLLSGGSDACASGGTVASGSNCLLQAKFAPVANGAFTYSLALSSNATNAVGQVVTYTGTAKTTASTTTTVAQSSPSGIPAYDQTVSFTVTVSSAAGTPAGSVSLIVDGITKQTTALTNGSVSFTLAGGVLTGGSHSIQAQYLGKDTGTIVYSASTSSTLTENVTTVATTSSVAYATAYITPNSQPAGTALVLTATVATTYAGTPTGTVTFNITDTGGNRMTATAALVPTSSGFKATYSYTPVAPASGTAFNVATVLVSYSGDINFSSSTSAASSFDVTGALGAVVTTVSSTSFTTSGSNPGSTTFTFVGYGGFTGVVGFSCDPSTLPADSRCQFSPGQVSIQASTASTSYPATTPVTLTLLVNQQPNVPTLSQGAMWWIALPSGLLLLVVRRRLQTSAAKGVWNMVLLAGVLSAMAASVVGTSGCASGAGFVTPKGTSTVTVYASSDPYQAGSTSNTMACGTKLVNGVSVAEPYLAPCSQQKFQLSVTVQ